MYIQNIYKPESFHHLFLGIFTCDDSWWWFNRCRDPGRVCVSHLRLSATNDLSCAQRHKSTQLLQYCCYVWDQCNQVHNSWYLLWGFVGTEDLCEGGSPLSLLMVPQRSLLWEEIGASGCRTRTIPRSSNERGERKCPVRELSCTLCSWAVPF